MVSSIAAAQSNTQLSALANLPTDGSWCPSGLRVKPMVCFEKGVASAYGWKTVVLLSFSH